MSGSCLRSMSARSNPIPNASPDHRCASMPADLMILGAINPHSASSSQSPPSSTSIWVRLCWRDVAGLPSRAWWMVNWRGVDAL